jgi:hypothetical protein
MPLRGIYHHVKDRGPLQRVILICSAQSILQAKLFIDHVLRRYHSLDHVAVDVLLASDLALKRWQADEASLDPEDGFDFEDFDALTEAYGRLFELLKKEGIASRQIQVDLTGGQKPTSIVAAVVTVGSRIANQYTCTNPKDPSAARWEYEVLGYDFIEPPRD